MGLFSSKQRGTRVADALPYQDLLPDGTVLCKDWGLMKVWYVQYPDAMVDGGISDDISDRIARTFQLHRYDQRELKVVYWFVMQRVPMVVDGDGRVTGLDYMCNDDGSPNADTEIERYREEMFGDSRQNNINENYACCKVQVDVSAKGISSKSLHEANEVFRSFEAALHTIGASPRPCVCSDEDSNLNIMSFLKYNTGTTLSNFAVPKDGMTNVSDYLSTNFIQKGSPMLVGDLYTQVLTINTFPSETYPNILADLESLPFCFRWVTRWIPRNNYESQAIAKKMLNEYKSATKGWKTTLYEQTSGKESDAVEAQAVTDTEEMKIVSEALTHGETIGEMTSVLVLMTPKAEQIKDMVSMVKRVITSSGFDIIEENASSNFPAWLSAIPGDSSSNRRKPFVTASNISHIVPFTNLYHGGFTNFFLKSICGVGWPHAIGRLRTNELYYLNLNGPKDDVGHTFMVGATGGGKSILLAFLGTQWMRYPGSRVILFDKDLSFGNICRRTGGAVYIPGAEDSKLSFMPLSRMKTKPSQAVGWLETVIMANGVQVTPEMSAELMAICQEWDNAAPTLERFINRLRGRGTQAADLCLPSLQRLQENEDIARLFGGEKDEFNKDSFRRKTLIEMGQLMNMGDIAVLPALQFLFDRMDELFDYDPKPTLLILDEAWKFLSHPVFRAKIKEWLKTLRKKHVFVIMAIQNINDIDDAEEFLTSCHTKIFLPNSAVKETGSEKIRELYLKMGVSETEIDIIGNAIRKAEYYIKQDEGGALVNFNLDSWQLERIARDGR